MVDAPFIGTVPHGPIQPAYLAIVEEVRAMLGQRLGRRLHSLYLYGSVATSKAVSGFRRSISMSAAWRMFWTRETFTAGASG